MKKYAPEAAVIHEHHDGKFYTLPYWLPPQKVGDIEINVKPYKMGSIQPVVSMRNALFMGLKACNIRIDHPTYYHELIQKDQGMWITSHFQELEQHHRQLRRMRGNVLVGGLGLGIAVAILEKNPKVTSITVVEQSPAIITVITSYLPMDKTVIVQDDLFNYLKKAKEAKSTWDYAFYDIWCPTGERMLKQFTLPLRKLSIGMIPQQNIEQWNEDEMLGQVVMALQTESGALLYPSPADPSKKVNKLGFILALPEEQFQSWASTNSTGTYWNAVRKGMENNEINRKHYLQSLKNASKWLDKWEEYEIKSPFLGKNE